MLERKLKAVEHQISNINLPEESVELTKELALKKNKVDNLRKRLNT